MKKKIPDQPQMIRVWTNVFVRVIAIIIGLLIAIWLLYRVRTLLLLLVVSIFFSYLMAPIVSLFEHPVYIRGREIKLPRAAAILVVYLVVGGVLFFSLQTLLPKLWEQLTQLTANLPTYVTSASSDVRKAFTDANSWLSHLNLSDKVQDYLQEQISHIAQLLLPWLEASVIGLLAYLQYLPWLNRIIDSLMRRNASPLPSWLLAAGRAVSAPFRWLMARTGEGFYDFNADGSLGRLLPGHVFALVLFAASLIVYLVLGSLHLTQLSNALPMRVINVSPIGYVLVAVMMICWGLGAVAFYFDRYRIPILALLVGFLIAGSQFLRSDHIYVTYPTPAGLRRPTPVEMLAGRDKVILIAAAGGGIQAAAWSTRVLDGLAAEHKDFTGSVRLISSVSGGSVGAFFFLNKYDAVRPAGAAPPPVPFDGATASLMEPISWGLVHPDLRRILIPWSFAREVDRGWALERAMAKNAQLSGVRLSHMVEAIPRGAPALLVNATQVTAGSPMVFSTTTFEHSPHGSALMPQLIRPFYSMLRNRDVDLATAVRLSATFPYVSPAARAYHDQEPHAGDHVVDGGYYDNFGMASLMAWLENGLEGLELQGPKQKVRILVIQIVSFPLDPEGRPGARSWVYQLAAPLLALFNAREEGQQQRNASQFRLLRDQMQGSTVATLDTVTFRYNASVTGCEKDPPLSWHLRGSEKACVAREWDQPGQRGCREQVRHFLETGELSSSVNCPESY